MSIAIAIRFCHPSRNLDFIGPLLDKQCFRTWEAGSKKTTITGEPLNGVNGSSYWTSFEEFSNKEGFISQINSDINVMLKHEDVLHELTTTGGKVELYLQLPGGANVGGEIEASALLLMGKLGIDLLIEVFPGA